jgi:putrescine:ornithine antiporter
MKSVKLFGPRGHRVQIGIVTLAVVASAHLPLGAAAQPADAALAAEPATLQTTATPEPARGTLDRVRVSGKLNIAYRTDARPLSFRDEAGKAAGYTIDLCRHVADAVKAELHLGSLDVNWLPVERTAGVGEVRQARADLLCADMETLAAREQIAFSIPVFPAGVGAVVRTDAPERLREVLAGGKQQARPLWRGSTAALDQRTFAVVDGSPVADWLAGRIDTFKVIAEVTKVASVEDGVQRVLDGDADVFFGERTVVLDAATRSSGADELKVIDRQFTVEPVAIGLARGDEELRLVVDRALSRLFRSEDFSTLYAQWFGTPEQNAFVFLRGSALPE